MASKDRGSTRNPVQREDVLENETSNRNDPTEIRIYIKQLRKALRFLPIGSRANYYLEGELVRANKTLKASVPVDSSMKGPQ